MILIIDLVWALLLVLITSTMIFSDQFVFLTSNYPVSMGFMKFFVLATMGELLGRRLTEGKWQIKGINLHKRAFVWGLFGILFTYVFPIFSYGVDGLIKSERLPVIFGLTLSKAFYKSFFMNILFAFPMMSLHRFTDTLIDQNRFFSKWNIYQTMCMIDWENMLKKVAPSIIWFWIPAHTITFCLAEEYRILAAALLGIALGLILSIMKNKES
ncbi:MAG: hypothetical protein GY714_06630 [Desulfobacterales bacterium]|nr:hypothetical protein [Desulfobacterales bacterium]